MGTRYHWDRTESGALTQAQKSYSGWQKSCTTLDGWNPINNEINHLSTGAGFLPFTVCCQYHCRSCPLCISLKRLRSAMSRVFGQSARLYLPRGQERALKVCFWQGRDSIGSTLIWYTHRKPLESIENRWKPMGNPLDITIWQYIYI